MRKKLFIFCIATISIFHQHVKGQQNVGIGTMSPNSSALLRPYIHHQAISDAPFDYRETE